MWKEWWGAEQRVTEGCVEGELTRSRPQVMKQSTCMCGAGRQPGMGHARQSQQYM